MSAETPPPLSTEPVTVVVTRRVKPGQEQAYEAWLERLLAKVRGFEGYLGTSVQRPAPNNREYTSVFRFQTVQQLRAFELSDVRWHAMLEVADLVEADAVWNRLTGFEFWFTPPPGTAVPQPSRLRMALVMIAVVYGLVLSIGGLVALVLAAAPTALRLLVTIAIEVFVMTYVLMPRLTRALAFFIYPKPKAKAG